MHIFVPIRKGRAGCSCMLIWEGWRRPRRPPHAPLRHEKSRRPHNADDGLGSAWQYGRALSGGLLLAKDGLAALDCQNDGEDDQDDAEDELHERRSRVGLGEAAAEDDGGLGLDG